MMLIVQVALTNAAELAWPQQQHILGQAERRAGTPRQNDRDEGSKCHVVI